jgi:hypothetical protein
MMKHLQQQLSKHHQTPPGLQKGFSKSDTSKKGNNAAL